MTVKAGREKTGQNVIALQTDPEAQRGMREDQM